MAYSYDTIAAISTSLSPAGIGIIRVSGPDAIVIVDRCFKMKNGKSLKDVASHTINYGFIMKETHTLDEVLVSVMKAPNSFTKEDVAEINCHGGIIVLEKVLTLVMELGARLAEPGEFTKRAFLNGRIDLSQAEAIMDIINAKSDMALEASVNHLKGILKIRINEIKDKVITIIAHVEASIDYPEYEIEDLEDGQLITNLSAIKDEINELRTSYDHGKILREGIKTVIIGKPNVGKSSLLNALLREQKAIVTDVPGTTRDAIEAYMNIHGVPLNIIDTAGIRDTDDYVEQIGVGRAKNLIIEAELVIFMADASGHLDDNDFKIIELVKDKKVIVLLNKVDLDNVTTALHLKDLVDEAYIIPTSIKMDQGITVLENKIKEMFSLGKIDFNDQAYITNIRHKKALDKAMESVGEVIAAVEDGVPSDCYSIDLKNIYEAIGELTGDTVSEDLLKALFSQFCLGK
ncbi:MAG: tRNA uridine-5-carboxymethylaminomethyl(34) synthesis GTPase MnmE [Vallitaleaceae bacterium]|nr:tRNA uridine-5-carboxymethylaminomethyl(34) synthesis GTPase MnmE [Vallitaleaceae bacterium]